MSSLKKQITLSVVFPLVITLAGLSYYNYQDILHEVEEIFDAELSQMAHLIAGIVQAHQDRDFRSSVPVDRVLGHKYEKHISYQVWQGKKLLLRSQSAPQVPLSDEFGFSDRLIDHKLWRVFAFQAGPYIIFTAEDFKARQELAQEALTATLISNIAVIVLIILLIPILVHRSLKRLLFLSEQVKNQDIYHLKPLDIRHIPIEIAPLIQSFNELLGKLDESLQKEREFTANASHELKTPLSSIKLHAQLAQKIEDPRLQKQALKKVLQAVDQSNHLIDQLLVLSRLPEDEAEIEYDAVYMPGLCRDIHQAVEHDLKRKKVGVQLVIPSDDLPLTVESNEQLLRIIFRNLLDNAIRYSPDHSQIKCKILVDEIYLTVLIMDQGPGIPEEQLKKVNRRFYRLAGQETKGCGIGLSIVEQAVKAIGAKFKLYNREDGDGLIAMVKIKRFYSA